MNLLAEITGKDVAEFCITVGGQFVLTGIVNPRKLFANPDGKRDHD